MPNLFWFTGQAGAGKTELANALKTQLHREQTIIHQNIVPKNIWSSYIPNKKFVIIDGDDIRELYHNTDYSLDGRKKNVDFVQKLCLFLIKNGITPIVSMVSPFLEQRTKFIEEHNGVQIYVYCNEIRGREQYHVDYYEPASKDSKAIIIDTTNKTVSQSFKSIWNQISFND